MTDPTPIAWRAIRYDSPVLAADGTRLGSVREVLGSDAEDIFHGLRLNLDGRVADDVVISADRVASMTTDGISTDVAPGEVASLPHYSEEATFHLASVGWLRKHLGWSRDSHSDEEPG